MADMLDNVITLDVVTKLDINPDRILKEAVGSLQNVVVLGWDKDGEEYFASSLADGGDVLWLLERLKIKLLTVMDD